tara:strand:- start:4767 stop:5762 length:996 start_codon:yes stop_codon:yes gene_type:complete
MLLTKIKELFKGLSSWFLRGNNRVKLLFLFISLFLWFIIKLSQTGYHSPSHFKLDYYDLPLDRILLKEGPDNIQIDLEGSGFSLLRYKWFNSSSVAIDINSLPELEDGRRYWLTNKNLREIESDLGLVGTQILKIKPDTLFFDLGRLMSKKVPIVANYNADFDTNQFVLYRKIRLSPDSVLITAPAQDLWKIEEIYTQPILLNEPSDSMQVEVALDIPKVKNFQAEFAKTTAILEFSSLAEAKIEVPIIAINNPDSTRFEIIPNKAEILYRTALRDFKDIRADEFLVYANYNDIAENPEARFISLKIESPPQAVRYLQINPQRVEFIITPL